MLEFEIFIYRLLSHDVVICRAQSVPSSMIAQPSPSPIGLTQSWTAPGEDDTYQLQNSCLISIFCFRVLVLDAGKVAEFDSPINLIKTKGIFYEMAKDAGLA